MRQIELEIGGEKRTFYFGIGFLGELLDKEGVSVGDIDTKIASNPFKWMPLIMYYSLAWGYVRKNEKPLFDAFSVAEWVDELGLESTVVIDFFKAFRQSLVKDVPEQEDKKKVTKK